MRIEEQYLELPRGSDIRESMLFKADGVALDMTGHTIEIFESEAWFGLSGSVSWTDQAGGEAVLLREWDNSAPQITWVRIRTVRTLDGFDDAYPKINVKFV